MMSRKLDECKPLPRRSPLRRVASKVQRRMLNLKATLESGISYSGLER